MALLPLISIPLCGHAQDIFLKGQFTEIGIHPAFSFGSSTTNVATRANGYHTRANTGRLGFVCDHNKDGWGVGTATLLHRDSFMGDYFTPGSPVEGWGINWDNTSTYVNFPLGSPSRFQIAQSSFSSSVDGSNKLATWRGIAGNATTKRLEIIQEVKLDTLSTYFTVSVFVKNIGTTQLDDVTYFRSVDPDNEQPITGSYSTNNRILLQPGHNGNSDTAIVVARGSVYDVPIYLGAIDSRAKVSRINFINYTAAGILNNANAPESTSTLADRSINIAFELGDLDTGECALFTFFYALSDQDINDIELPIYNDFSFQNGVETTKTSCADSTVNFFDNSQATGLNFVNTNEWDFDNDTIYEQVGDSVTHTFPGWGTYPVRKKVTLCNGDVYDTLIYVNIKPGVIADFTLSKFTICENDTRVEVTNNSTTFDGNMSFLWTFESGVTTTDTNVVRNFVKDTLYSMKLYVENDSGCTDSFLYSQNIIVRPKPVPSFTTDTSRKCFNNHLFDLTNTSTIPFGTMTYTWQIDSLPTTTGVDRQATFLDTGSYALNLVAVSNFGCTDSIQDTLYVVENPSAAFSIADDRQCISSNSFNFTDASTSNSPLTTWDWNINFEDTLTSQNVVNYTFDREDTFSIRLVATNGNNCTDTIIQTVIVDSMPVADYSIVDTFQCLSGNTYIFDNQSTTNYGALASVWNLGDGTGSTLDSITSHTYAYADTMLVKLTITNVNLCKDSITKAVVVLPMPSVSWTINQDSQCFNNQNYLYTNTTTIDYGALSYQWFYDNRTTASTDLSLTDYSTYGVTTTKLIATSDSGCVDSFEANAYVRSAPQSIFHIEDDKQCFRGNSFNFRDSSLNADEPIVTRQWLFTDGTSYSTANVLNKQFATHDTFSVSLIAGTANGCSDTSIQQVIIDPMPVSSFTISDSAQCYSGNLFRYKSEATIPYGSVDYIWLFGDDSTSTTPTIDSTSYSYQAYDSLDVSHIVISTEGCADTSSKKVIIYPNPVAGFTIPTNYMCFSGNSFDFVNSTTLPYGTTTYDWNLGDGATSTDLSIYNKSYTSFGFFDIKLIAESDQGCLDSATDRTGVAPKPTADFEITSDSLQCLTGNSVNLENKSTVPTGWLTDYAWNFKDGTPFDSSFNISNKTFSYADTFWIRSTIISNDGCKDSIDKMVVIWPQADIDFNINDSLQCFNTNSFDYTNLTTIEYGTLTYSWDFGDGGSSTAVNETNRSYAVDTFAIRLASQSDVGCTDTITKEIEIYPSSVPSFSISDDIQCYNYNTFDFTNTTTLSDGTLSYSWDLGNGSISSATDTNNVIYSTADTFSIKLVSTTNYNCSDSITELIYVHPNPVSSFTINDNRQCFNLNNFIYRNTSTIETGSYTNAWSLGDQSTSSLLDSVVRVYETSDTFTVTLVSTSGLGCKDTIDAKVVVDSVPQTDFSINEFKQCYTGNSFDYTNLTTTHAGTLVYEWLLGDGSTTSTTDVTAKQYSTPDSTSVSLKAENIFGCRDSIEKLIYIFPQPVAGFTINDNRQCFAHNTFHFVNTSTAEVGTFGSQWSFTDGYSSTSKDELGYLFSTSDSFDIKLLITNTELCSDSITQQVIVDPEPTVSYVINDDRQCFTGNNFIFTNASVPNVGTNTYTWNLSTGETFTSVNVNNKSFVDADTFDMQLIAINTFACVDSVTQTVIIDDQPVAAYSVDTLEQCLVDNEFNYTNESTTEFGGLLHNWTLSDGTSYTSPDLNKVFASFNTFIVKLLVTNEAACKDSITKSVTVHPQPVPNFTISKDEQCFRGNTFDYLNTTTIAQGSATNQWFLGDGDTRKTNSIAGKEYLLVDTLAVKLIATSAKNCVDSITQNIVVHPNPIADFTINQDKQCFLTNTFEYTNTSTIKYNRVLNQAWTLGDGTVASTQNITNKVYATPQVYSIRLTETSPFGCTDDTVRNVTVYNSPTAVFTVVDSSQCLIGNSFDYSNSSFAPFGTLQNEWVLDDGEIQRGVDVANKNYQNDGSYTVRLVITDTFLCTDTAYRDIIIHPHPVAIIDVEPTCENIYVEFTSNSTIKNTSLRDFNWSFGDGNTSSDENPIHLYDADNTYTVALQVTSDENCTHDTSTNVVIWEKPDADFSWQKVRSFPKESEYQYTDLSTAAGPVVEWEWLFGDGQVEYIQDPLIRYLDTATYYTRLVATDTNNCKDTIVKGPEFIAPDYLMHIPTAFSPNNDRLNEEYKVVVSEYLLNFSLKIYNRWGEVIFVGDNENRAWDGTYKGKKVPAGQYLYTIETRDIFRQLHHYNGTIVVLR